MAKKLKRFTYHPVCSLFPLMNKEDLRALAEDIKANGQLEPVVMHEGRVLEGRNRVRACRMAGVKPRTTEWDGNGSALEFVISKNLARRHLTSSQRAAIAVKLLPMLEKEARERQRAGKRLAKNLAVVSVNGKASQIAAKLTRTNSHYVEQVKRIQAKSPEVVEKIREGVVKVAEAAELAELPPARLKVALRKLNGGHRPFFQGCNRAEMRQNDVVTPPGIAQFLHDIVWPHYRPGTILDPCAGDGALTKPWRKKAELIKFEIKKGTDFFARTTPLPHVRLTLCNPPFNGNPDSKEAFPFRFLRHILTLVPEDSGVVFFAPFHLLFNSRTQSNTYAGQKNRYAWFRDDCPDISSFVPLPQDAFVPAGGTGPLVHAQILFFRMPKLAPCYFIPGQYLR
jgi:hypothetical protein